MKTLQSSSGVLTLRAGPFSPDVNLITLDERVRPEIVEGSLFHHVFLSFPSDPSLLDYFLFFILGSAE